MVQPERTHKELVQQLLVAVVAAAVRQHSLHDK